MRSVQFFPDLIGGKNVKYTVKEVLQFVEGNDVKFVRLVFFDIFGIKKNLSIMASELKNAFEKGIYISAGNIDGFADKGHGDLLLFPDPNTLKVLPWRPQQGAVIRLLCDIRYPDGKRFPCDVRTVLKRAMLQANEKGINCFASTRCEFYLFRLDDDGCPTRIPQDNAGYLDIAPLDRGEDVRRQICLTLEDMEIAPVSSHHDIGPGQNEIEFRYNDLISAADDINTFKSVVKTAAASNGLYASFMPKPVAGCHGSGMYTGLIVRKYKENLFSMNNKQLSPTARSFIAGIVRRAPEMMLFLSPLSNSYARLTGDNTPDRASWSFDNEHSFVRLMLAQTDKARLEFRTPDPSCNLYLGLALLLFAGLEGIEDELELCSPDSAESPCGEPLPRSLADAVQAVQGSEFIRKYIPQKILSGYISKKREEIDRSLESPEYRQHLDDRLFELI